MASRRSERGGGQAMTWEHEVVILEKNVRDLQKQLNQAHKRIKTLVDQNTRKNVSLKAINEIVRKETEADIDGIVSL